ncbi:MAG: GTP 3',8-cyclase MoaA, partial [Alphaproteobacteria bacterium]|nr:GTP 3',8-cyclase MoaA [Alphaproteobacteria bacterium]
MEYGSSVLIDRSGRKISYVRLSLTDRCDMRCRYCMAENMTFLPRADILTFEEIAAISSHFVARGVRRIRLTGGEPLVRRGAVQCASMIGKLLDHGLEELTLTTNGTFLAEHAAGLWDAGIRRINISLDTRDPERFHYITRQGSVEKVLQGIAVAQQLGFRIKINMVALKGLNDHEIPEMLQWCIAEGLHLSLIETMPLGIIDDDRLNRFVSLKLIMPILQERFPMVASTHRTGGPARYWQIVNSKSKLGLISPLSNNFCADCNRVRVSAEGKLYMCLGHEAHIDLRKALRTGDVAMLDMALDQA